MNRGVNGKRSSELLVARSFYDKALAKEPKNDLARAALKALE
jgi:hypothetical protein